ncbi:MAG: ComEC/Rec2 family competence protein [Alphaproteobacteria bacterium]
MALWLPVAFGGGALVYFRLSQEPSSLWPIGLAAAGGGLLWMGRRLPLMPAAALALVLFAAGWGWSQLTTEWAAAPVVGAETRPVDLQGRVVDLEPLEGASTRAVLDRVSIAGWEAGEVPVRVRINVRASDRPIRPGDLIRARAILRPPPPPVAPGGYDFQRQAWFAQIGAVGFALGAVTVVDSSMDDDWSFAVAIERVRRAIAADIAMSLDGPEAALAGALVIGERGAMAETDRDALRDAGLAHLLAISGLHITIVAGFLFWIVRAALARIPAIAVRWPIKKWAAVAALASAFVYMLIAGATPPTQRAFLMIAIALAAVMIDRNPISMRLVAVAAFAVLVLSPSTVLGPSFQLSFAAVVALIAAFEWVQARKALMTRGRDRRARPLIYLAATLYSSLIATIATAPFSLFHFQQVALYGLVANLVAIPLMAFWIMPLLAIGCLAALFGIGEVGFVPAGWGIDALRLVAHEIAGWPGAVFRAPLAPEWTMAMAVAGGLWLCLWRSRMRWIGLAPAMVGLSAMALARPPDIVVSGFGTPFAVLSRPEGQLQVPSLRRDLFTTTSWARLAGLDPEGALVPLPPVGEGGALRCDGFGCIATTLSGARIALSRRMDALDDDCRGADLVVQLFPGGEACPTGVPTIRYLDLVIDGAHLLYVGADGAIGIATVGADRGHRPWVTTNR